VSIDRRAGLRVFSDLEVATPLPLSWCKQLCRGDRELPKTMQTKRKTMIVAGAGKGIGAGLAITRSLAMGYAKEGIRFNGVAYAMADAPAL
jgi:hypothetical protein